MFKLVIQDDEGKTTVVPLIRDEITIGRKEGNTIRLTERNVSRRHARILRNNGEVHIEDLGSYNGIRVNNARIAERVSLRVSDQVQIGDYKLYLKAEGVEQVDDARTMPIERVDATAEVGAVAAAAAAAPTAPVPIPVVPGIPKTPAPGQINAQLVGHPNHTLVAVADTDPQGRPLASAAAIAALAPPMGFGKLVVLSSNFAGKEFDLSRPQMIVGRTDENDLVINHRSISRNHAKLVREPDTGRYTISDLQSSNGVRVNGQDYGKVELRRGDVIDLGHVRLRFVEPGEDFVFSRDAVITDVPDVGGKKGLLVAIVLGILVLGGVAIFFLTRGPKDDTKNAGTGSGSSSEFIPDAGSNTVAIGPTIDAKEDVIPEQPDAGSNVPTGTDVAERELRAECLSYQANKKWVELETCAASLAKFDPKAKELTTRAVSEHKAEVALRNLGDALTDKDFKKARTLLKDISDGSVYRKDADATIQRAEKVAIDELVGDLRGLLTKDCVNYRKRLTQEASTKGEHIADAARKQVKCTERPDPPPLKTCADTGCPANQTCGGDGKCKQNVVVVQPPACDPAVVAADEATADASNAQGSFAAALSKYEAVLKCKGSVLQKTYMAACKARKFDKAKTYFDRVPATRQESLSQICMREGFDPRKP